MKSRTVMLLCIAALMGAVPPASAASGRGCFVRPGTLAAARAMTRLRQARHVDWMNSQSFAGGEDNAASAYYYHKAEQANALMWMLHEGRPVLTDEVKRALDNSDAWRYGGTL